LIYEWIGDAEIWYGIATTCGKKPKELHIALKADSVENKKSLRDYLKSQGLIKLDEKGNIAKAKFEYGVWIQIRAFVGSFIIWFFVHAPQLMYPLVYFYKKHGLDNLPNTRDVVRHPLENIEPLLIAFILGLPIKILVEGIKGFLEYWENPMNIKEEESCCEHFCGTSSDRANL